MLYRVSQKKLHPILIPYFSGIVYWTRMLQTTFLQNIFLHMLVKFQRIIRNAFLDIAFEPKAPIFKIAQILDYRQ